MSFCRELSSQHRHQHHGIPPGRKGDKPTVAQEMLFGSCGAKWQWYYDTMIWGILSGCLIKNVALIVFTSLAEINTCCFLCYSSGEVSSSFLTVAACRKYSNIPKYFLAETGGGGGGGCRRTEWIVSSQCPPPAPPTWCGLWAVISSDRADNIW